MNYKILLFSSLMSGVAIKAMNFVEPPSFLFECHVDGTIKIQKAFSSFDELVSHVNNSSNYNYFLSSGERADGIDMKLNVSISTKKVYWNLFKRFYEKGKEYTTATILKRSKKDGYFIVDEEDPNYASYNVKSFQVSLGQLTGMIYPTGIGWCSIFGIGALSLGIYKLWWKK